MIWWTRRIVFDQRLANTLPGDSCTVWEFPCLIADALPARAVVK
jgi:hypothetical protein